MQYMDEMWTPQELADYLKLPVSWVYERTSKRVIPMRKIGRHVRIPKAEFLAWLEAQTDNGRLDTEVPG